MPKRKISGCGWALIWVGLSLVCGTTRTSNESGETAQAQTNDDQDATPIPRETYLEHRQSTLDGAREAQQNLDKALLTLSAGAFGLSIAFVSQVALPAQSIGFLFISWVAFLVSIISELFSFVTSKRAHERDVELLDEDYVSQSGEERYSSWNAATKFLNVFAGGGFLAGTVFLSLFVARNVI